MYLGRGINQETGQLIPDRLRIGRKRELAGLVVAVLRLQRLEVDRPGIQPRGGTRLHAARFKPNGPQAFGDPVRCGIASTSPLGLLRTAVHHPRQKGAAGENHGPGSELHPHTCPHTGNPQTCVPPVEEQLRRGVLPNIEVGRVLERLPPSLRKTGFVALRTRTPHGRPFRAVEHPELHGREVGNTPRLPAQSIYFSDYLPFSHTSYRRIAGHIGQLGHIHRQQQRPQPHPRGRRGGLASGMTAAHYDKVVLQLCHLPILSFVHGTFRVPRRHSSPQSARKRALPWRIIRHQRELKCNPLRWPPNPVRPTGNASRKHPAGPRLHPPLCRASIRCAVCWERSP